MISITFVKYTFYLEVCHFSKKNNIIPSFWNTCLVCHLFCKFGKKTFFKLIPLNQSQESQVRGPCKTLRVLWRAIAFDATSRRVYEQTGKMLSTYYDNPVNTVS